MNLSPIIELKVDLFKVARQQWDLLSHRERVYYMAHLQQFHVHVVHIYKHYHKQSDALELNNLIASWHPATK